MILKIQKRENPFVQIDKRMIRDSRLSWKARGMLTFLLSFPEDWEVRTQHLLKNSSSGIEAVYSGLKELKSLGYAELVEVKEKGRFVNRSWIIKEEPDLGFAGQDEAGLEKRGHTNNDDTSYRQIKNCRRKSSPCSPSTSTDRIFDVGGEVCPFVRKASAILEDFVRSSRKLNRKFNRPKWHQEMGLLLQELDGDKLRLKRALMSYVTHPHDKFTPQAESAESFRRKFLAIESWVNENEPPLPKETIHVENVKTTYR